MLVVTPGGPSLADRKPRVISEIRKVNVQRSPSLDGHPKLSGILNYYSDCLGIWTQRTVAVRDGCLLVYGADCTQYDYTPARSYASLGRTPTPRRGIISDIKGIDSSRKYTPDQCYKLNSLNRLDGFLCGVGGAEFRLPLRHLNLMPSSLAARAFSLSYRQNGNGSVPVATFQALSQLEYERWVKTLAVEIMRQTPLEAIRFLDVLGIAAFNTPSGTAKDNQNNISKHLIEDKKKNNVDNRRASSHDTTFRWDRSPSSEGSTTSTDFITTRKSEDNTPLSSKKYNSLDQTVVRRKLQMSDVESQSDRDEVDCIFPKASVEIKQSSNGRKSREKLRRSRDVFANGSSSDDTRALDEGIVIEERGSSSDRSCRRVLWSSDRSDFLDSPHSISSFSSYERCDSSEHLDTVDDHTLLSHKANNKISTKFDVISDKKFIPISYNSLPVEINCNNTENKKLLVSYNTNKKLQSNTTVDKVVDENSNKRKSPMQLYRAQPFINESSPEPEIVEKKVDFQNNSVNPQNMLNSISHVSLQMAPLIIVNNVSSWSLENYKNSKCWSRARSCSPNTKTRSPPRFSSSNRGIRALSVGQDNLPVPECDVSQSVEMLKQRCQNTENYVPVKEKLALFESLCRNGRLARSSEELAAIERSTNSTVRARSLHDLSRSRSPQVPVREMCKFFEKISNVNKLEKVETKQKTNPTKSTHLYEKFTSKSSSGDKYLKHKRNDCSNINKDSVFDKTIHKAKQGLDFNQNMFNYTTDNIKSNHSTKVDNNCNNDELEKSNYKNFTQIRHGNKIITYV